MRDGAALTIRRADQLEPRRGHGGFRARATHCCSMLRGDHQKVTLTGALRQARVHEKVVVANSFH
jgi:hypothetical protein